MKKLVRVALIHFLARRTLRNWTPPWRGRPEDAGGHVRYETAFPSLDGSVRPVELCLIPSLSDAGRVRTDADLRRQYEVINDFFLGLTVFATGDGRPPSADATRRDFGSTITCGWPFPDERAGRAADTNAHSQLWGSRSSGRCRTGLPTRFATPAAGPWDQGPITGSQRPRQFLDSSRWRILGNGGSGK